MQTSTRTWAGALAVAGVLATATGCGGVAGNDASPIPSTGVPEAAQGARGVALVDLGPQPAPTGADPFGGQSPFQQPGIAPNVPPAPPPPSAIPPDPFGSPPLPSAPVAPAPPPRPDPGVTL